MKHRPIIALAVGICLSLAGGAHAQFFIPNDLTIDFQLNQSFVAGYKDSTDFALRQNGTSPAVMIVDGAFLAEGGVAASGSTVNMSGGTNLRILSTTDGGTVNLTGGSVNGLNAGGQGMVSMSGGTTVGVSAQQNGILTVTGGQIRSSVQLFDSGMAKISGVTIGQMIDGNLVAQLVRLRNQSMLELEGATLGTPTQGAIELFDTGKVKLTNTTVLGGVFGLGQNTVEINGGNLSGGVVAFNIKITGATVGGGVTVQGAGAEGTISRTQAASVSVGPGPATLSVTGSTIAGEASAFSGSVLSVSDTTIGTNLSVTGGGGGVTSATMSGGSVGGNVTATGQPSPIRNAIIEITSGSVTGNVNANDASQVTLGSVNVGGNVTAVGSNSGGLLQIQGGTITGNVIATARGELLLSGGTVMGDVRATGSRSVGLSGVTVMGNLLIDGSTDGTMSGGSIAGMATLDGDSFTMSGGSIAKDVVTEGSSTFSMQAGMIGGDLKLEGGVSTISGGSIAGGLSHTFGRSEMTGGTVSGNVVSNTGSDSLTISGGQVLGTLGAQGRSTLNVSGGSITDVGGVIDTATLNVSGTAIFNDQLNAFAAGTLNFSGGGAKSVGIADQSTLNMSGSAFIVEGLTVLNGGIVNLNGGKVTGDLKGNDSSVVVMAGGEVFNAVTEEGSTLVVQGGTIRGSLTAQNSSVVRLNGGSVSGQVTARQNTRMLVGGAASIGNGLAAFETSTTTIEGGRIDGVAAASDNSTINVSGSAIIAGDLQTDGGGKINMSGGSVQGDLRIPGNGKLVLSGGTVAGKLLGSQRADIVMIGGTVGKIEANLTRGGGSFTVGGGQVTGDVTAFNDSAILMAGGAVNGIVRAQGNSVVAVESVATVAGSMAAFNNSTVNMRGGTVGVGTSPTDLEASDNSTINLSGGTVGRNLSGFQNSTINMSGGTVFGRGIFRGNAKFNFTGGKILGGIEGPGLQAAADEPLNLTAFDSATINLIGASLIATLVDPNFQGTSSKYELSGFLADGTPIDGGFLSVQNATQATFHLLPGGNWKLDSGGSWGLPANWASAAVPDAPGAVAQFLGIVTAPNAPANITLDGDRTLGTIRFDNANPYRLQQGSGGTITLNATSGDAQINVTSGSHTISAPVALADNTVITVTPADGNLSITGAVSSSGVSLTKTGAGGLIVNHVRATALSVNEGALVIAPSGGDPGTSVIDTLSVNGTSRFDLSNNDLVVRATAGTKDAIHADVQAKIGSAQNGMDGNFITNWDGPGITSSFARTSNVMTGFDLTGIGAIRNSDIDIITGLPGSSYTSLSGQPVTPDDVLVRYTYIGDGNLDGLVSFDDYVGMDNAFFGLIQNLGWATGDINFDGVINFDDYTVVDQAFFFQGAPLTHTDVTTVPEPSTWALVILACLRVINMQQVCSRRPESVKPVV